MKKHLIAAAVAAAVAAPAFAQNVSISGRIDAGYSMTDATAANGVKTETDAIRSNTFTTSRIIFSGTEDLGGGLKASFNVETGIRAESNATTDSTSIGDRQFNATLSGGFGSVLIGRTDSMIKALYDGTDAGYANNMVGSIVSLDSGYTAGRDVTVRYTTPSFSGITASVGLMKNTVKVTATPDTSTNSGEEFGLRYAAGPLSAGLAYRDVENKTNVGGSSTQKDLGLGVSYNLGAVVLFGQYFDNEVKDKVANTKVDEQFYAIGVRVPLGAATIYASYIDGEQKNAAGTKLDREGMQLGVKYDLSKRTYGYLAYGDQESNATTTTKAKSDQLGIGIVHLF